MATDHLNQHGPLSQAGNAYIIRLSRDILQWEVVKPSTTFIIENRNHKRELKALFSDIMSARFYEIQGSGTNNLIEATQRLKQHGPTLTTRRLNKDATETGAKE